jgi:carbon-monoxide dehydrogenase iron sulfur subunit
VVKAENKTVRLHYDRDKCSGCLSCVIVCAERHTNAAAPNRARIRFDLDFFTGAHKAYYCRQCKKAPCAEACPKQAISLSEEYHAWLVDEALCDGCGSCVEACPFNATWLDPALDDRAIKCDLCLGETLCVEVCPVDALTLR